ncbi:hypothetical protein QQ045_025898 [Rhodiola kirilowii]
MFKFELGFDVDIRYALPPVVATSVDHQKSGFSVSFPIWGYAVGGALFLFFSLWFLCCYCVKIEQARLRLYGIIGRMEVGDIVIINGEQVEPMMEEDPVDHPIWYIRTQGLQQSVIDSISVVKYKKDEGLVEGNDCSICLSEFEEDESLRLLPKCAHAFHVPCIDQWFRSHKNCPLCRSPISQVIVAGTPMVTAEEAREAVEQENQVGLEGQQSDEMVIGDVNTSEDDSDSSVSENCRNGLIANQDSSFSRSNKAKPESTLSDRRRVTYNEVQPMRRTVSAGPVTASKIYGPVAEIKIQVESDANTDSVASPAQRMKATSSGSSTSNRNSPEKEQEKVRHTIMKRSASYGGKPAFAKSGKGQNPILPY